MKKIPLKVHPLQERIEAFQKTPVWENRPKNEEGRLKKIGRNRLVLKDVSLPLIAPIRTQVSEQIKGQSRDREQRGKGKENVMVRAGVKNLSFVKAGPLLIDHRVDRMAITQKMVYDRNEADKMKELAMKKQFLIREKKLVPQRNCISADLKKESLPQKAKQFRRNLIRKSREAKSEDIKDQPLHVQASRLAHQARAASAPHHNKSKFQLQSLEDFLNEWRDSRV